MPKVKWRKLARLKRPGYYKRHTEKINLILSKYAEKINPILIKYAENIIEPQICNFHKSLIQFAQFNFFVKQTVTKFIL